jgi:hypothetical protein
MLETVPSDKFPKQVMFIPKLPEFELVRKGFCQLTLACFRQLHTYLKKDFKLRDLTSEPEIIPYDDGSFAISWWPHLIYKYQDDRIYNHEHFALALEDIAQHKSYIAGEL